MQISILNQKIVAGLILLIISSTGFAADVKKSVVQIFNESGYPNFEYPWQFGDIEGSSGSGVIIQGGHILTAAHVVDNSVSLLVRKVGSDKRYPATVEFISDERDLALIDVEDKSFFENTEPLALGRFPSLGEAVITWGFPLGGNQLAITKGIISRIDFDNYMHSGFPNVVAQIDAAINGGASGGPALVDGKLAGINFQGLHGADNVGYIIPVTVVEQFLEDIKDGRVDGVPEIAIICQGMENPELRQHYGMTEKQSGALIVELSGIEKEIGLFKQGDVLLKVDGEVIGNDYTVSFPFADRIQTDYLLTRYQIGDSIPVEVLRDKEVIRFDYRFTYPRSQANTVPHHYSGFTPQYIEVGGVVLQELSQDYIKATYNTESYRSKNIPGWMEFAMFEYKKKSLQQPEHIIIVSKTLPDEINRGYMMNDYSRVKSINGHVVNSVAEIRQILADNTDDDIRIEFEPTGVLVFNKADLAKREPLIAEKYGITERETGAAQ